MSNRKIVLTLSLLICSPFLISWGVTGHRTIGRIAENHLSAKAKAAVQALLGNETLADASTWADEVRSQPEYRHTASWHFLNLPLGLSYPEFKSQVEGLSQENVYSALRSCEQTLTAQSSSRDQRVEALKFIVHFVGDLHQPMHISRAEDKGGNTIQLNYEGQGTNLHSLWDTRLLEQQGLTYEQLARNYDHASPEQIKQWQSDPVVKWIWESYEISSRLYAEVDAMNGRSIGDDYYNAHIPIVEKRIEQAGVRLAGLLNELFEHAPTVGAASAGGPASTPSGGHAANDAGAAAAQNTTYCDVVSGSKVFESSGMILLNLGGEYPNQKMTIMIKGKDRDKFPVSPEIAFKDKKICVKGTAIDYKGKPEIIVTDPSQITVE
jgi:hypothetical protein